MKSLFYHLRLIRDFDWVLVVVVCLLTAMGLVSIYSVDISQGSALIFFPTQAFAFALGGLALLIAGSIHLMVYQSSARLAYLGTVVLLIAVLIVGVTIRGTRGWFRIVGFSFQPSELAKVAVVLMLGWLIYRYGRRFDRWQFVVASGIITVSLAGLILLQPDLGSALVVGSVWVGLLFLTGVKKRYLVLLFGTGVVAVIVAWMFLFAPYQKDRVRTFLEPGRDPLGAGYNVNQSIIAIGSGQLLGRGLGFGSQSQLHFLPEAQTDFIFAVIAEELGFVGVAILFTLYSVLCVRLVQIATRAQSDFGAYVVLGVLLVFVVQAIVNIGGTVGLLPVTGVTLPFLSYGGSSLLVNFFMIGVVQSVYLGAFTAGSVRSVDFF